jgi:glycerol-3-phosphate acyltransferase PlsY
VENIVLAAGIGYLLGSIPFGFLIGRLKGVDVRRHGSGATGGTNVLRTLGPLPAAATALSDLVKGTIAAYSGLFIGGDLGYAVAAFGALAGHAWPVWLGFRGGKSVATGAGGLLLLHPWGFIASLAAGIVAVIPTRYVSLGSLVGGLVYCSIIWLGENPLSHKVLAGGAFVVVYARHWENIKRIVRGTENRFGEKVPPAA